MRAGEFGVAKKAAVDGQVNSHARRVESIGLMGPTYGMTAIAGLVENGVVWMGGQLGCTKL